MLYRILVLAGYKNFKEYLRDIADILIITIIASYFIYTLPIENSILIAKLSLLSGILYALLLPIIKIQRNKLSINKELPYFITFLSAISVAKMSRAKIFEIVEEAKEFGYLSKLMAIIKHLALQWRLGFAEAAKRVSKIVPSPILSEFLDRLSAVLEVGEDLEDFFNRERKTLLDSFEVEYKKSLENIRIIQEMFLSLSISIAFLVIVALFLPFFAGADFRRVLFISLIIFIVADFGMYVTYKFLIMEDRLIHNLKKKPKDYNRILLIFILSSMVSTIFYLFLEKRFPDYPLSFKLTLSLTPYVITGYLSIKFDKLVRKIESVYPSFIDAMGTALGIRGSSQIKALESILVHDFGILNEYIERLYRRIKYTLQYEKSWLMFAAETGSYLISRFSLIFVRATRIGADASKVAKVILEGYNRIMDLRKFRSQMIASMRGMLYGSFIAFVSTIFLGIYILRFIYSMFAGIPEMIPTEATGIISGLFGFNIQFDEKLAYTVADIMMIIHAFVISYTLKDADGGTKFGMFLDFIILLWIGTLMSLGIRIFLARLFTF